MPPPSGFSGSGAAYNRHIGRYGPALAAALADFAGIEAGMTAVDVGCGPGALTAELAARLGESNVSAAEPSESFAAACSERLPGVEVVVAPAEKLPFADARFDAALAQLVVNFMRDPEAGVRQMARVVKPGGTVAAAVWDYADEMTLLRRFWDAGLEVDPERAAAADEGAVMPWCREGALAELWGRATLTNVRFTAITVSAAYDSFDDLWSGFTAGIGPAGQFAMSFADDDRERLRDTYRRSLGVGDDAFELTARAWAAAGVRVRSR